MGELPELPHRLHAGNRLLNHLPRHTLDSRHHRRYGRRHPRCRTDGEDSFADMEGSRRASVQPAARPRHRRSRQVVPWNPEQRVLSLRASKGTQQEADQRNHRHSSTFDRLRFALGCYPSGLPGRGRGMADFCGWLRRMAGLSRRGTGWKFGNQRVERQRRGRQRSFRGIVGNSSDGFHLGSVPSAA